jgi:two-component sensor histidine kinase
MACSSGLPNRTMIIERFDHSRERRAGDIRSWDFATSICCDELCLFEVYRLPGRSIGLSLDLAELCWGVDQAMACGLILHELVSNSLTHAFPPSRAGEVAVTLQPEPPGRCTLVVRDTGVGLPEGFDFHTAMSLGLRLVGLMVQQLGGTLTLAPDGGTRVTITFPC